MVGNSEYCPAAVVFVAFISIESSNTRRTAPELLLLTFTTVDVISAICNALARKSIGSTTWCLRVYCIILKIEQLSTWHLSYDNNISTLALYHLEGQPVVYWIHTTDAIEVMQRFIAAHTHDRNKHNLWSHKRYSYEGELCNKIHTQGAPSWKKKKDKIHNNIVW